MSQHVMAECGRAITRMDDLECSPAERQANGLLVAAAPDMLVALRAALPVLDGIWTLDGDDERARAEAQALVAAAIARTEDA